MELNRIHEITKKYGTPLFIFDEEELVNRVREIKKIASCNICFSIKANPFLVSSIIDEVDYLEVCSPGELKIVKSVNVPGKKIIYSGVNKGYDDVKEAIEYGVKYVTAESLWHYELALKASLELKKDVLILPRLSAKNQFGMSIDDLVSVVKKSLSDETITVAGVHYFAGTTRKVPNTQTKDFELLLEAYEKIKNETGVELRGLEYGPGLGYPYFENESFDDTLANLKGIVPLLDENKKRYDITIEMGRFIASSCGYYVTSIADIKESSDTKWCIVDGGINHVNYHGQMMGMKKPLITHIKGDDECTFRGESGSYEICGSLCTANDILVKNFELTDPCIGDALVFKNIGAYSITEGISTFLSRDMAKVVLETKDGDRLLRDTVHSWEINTGLL